MFSSKYLLVKFVILFPWLVFCPPPLLADDTLAERVDTSSEQVVDLLPDLFPPLGVGFGTAPFLLFVLGWDLSSSVEPGRIFLRVDFGAANIGAGPLYIRSATTQNPDSSWDGFQRIFRSDSTWWERSVGFLDFHPDHGHVHFEDWGQYRLREILPGDGVGPILAESDKISFCILDAFHFAPELPGSPADRFFSTCDMGLQGESVGWIDMYSKPTTGQSFDVTEVPNGSYWLEGEADPANRLLESDETNNVARIRIQLCHQENLTEFTDSVLVTGASAEAGQKTQVDVHINNTIRLKQFVAPITYSGDVRLRLDSASNAGLRSEILGPPIIIHDSAAAGEVIYKVETTSQDTQDFMPIGFGPVLRLHFTILPQTPAPVDSTNIIQLVPIELRGPAIMIDATITDACGQFVPQNLISGSITLEETILPCCDTPGDANNSGSVNISDVTFLIARIFAGGSAPDCSDEADANGNDSVNISDVTFLIARIFAGGPAPECGTTGV